ncbi:hypothetical protein A3F07_02735 [candidate division WWE3 bacterium RIFCSPHIGHO2_12_FULL_38_15]|uniref:Uncharacterized protein n=1 Tax=candidate division WWE3 bacterium RIFCSPHIGHO2_02_FULL_38_14 TaxID=1802620 RepID=A0A1F4VA41_UNCKA|nr:MAG: hypothetical protein A2793_04360 [candidate division WWE3 bacterium RIFCSPHIGHO2_01_FULL_38_45]OGC49330.1 MAG: hypothetical protein A3F07_02735 [candidate division WWE3 bacterium RIFCSPHIGHO2_12_FULL_38_15]OGC53933.1 MAG: hypothetical protein A3B64_02840 [candidate division WWE3 bacterium RIFCSPLOWO2_01_FULL_37_24]OGC54009.1 MAG: hypothetical protein A3D91_04575 [candidate division WWE3 bacterium RIFCSPHIGHO2_02_FULL_38_14]
MGYNLADLVKKLSRGKEYLSRKDTDKVVWSKLLRARVFIKHAQMRARQARESMFEEKKEE